MMMTHLVYITTDIWIEQRILQSIAIGGLHVVKLREVEVIMDLSVMEVVHKFRPSCVLSKLEAIIDKQ